MPQNKAAPKKERCYIYIRVSTQMQVDGYSLDAQRDLLIKEAKHRDMVVVAEFSDEGKSGKNTTGRPQFTEMLNRIKNGNPDDVSYVLVFKLSRFGRNAADILNSLRLMRGHGVNLLAVKDQIDSTSDSGRLIITVLAAVAEIERENINAQTMAGRWQKAREGKWNGGQAPYGYRIGTRDEGKDGVLVVNEDEAPLVRLIFDKYVHTAMGINSVAKWLNENGHRKRPRQNGVYVRISATFVKTVLDNPVYIGKIAYGRRKNEKKDGTDNEYHVIKQDSYEVYPGQHEPLIDEDTWYMARAKRELNDFKREKTHSLDHVHLLSGLVRCPVCGGQMYGVVNRKKKKDGSGEHYTDMWYYLCKNTKVEGPTRCTYTKHVRQDDLDGQVFAIVKDAFLGTDFTERMRQKIGTRSGIDELNAELDGLQAGRKKEERQKSKLAGKIMALDADDPLYDSMYETLQGILREHVASIAELDRKIEEVGIAIHNAAHETAVAEHTLELTKAIAAEMMDVLMEPEQARRIFHLLIESIQIFPEPMPDGLILKSVKFRIPMEYEGDEVWGAEVDMSAYDSLPDENHDETVCLLSKLRAEHHIEVDLNLDELDLTAAERRPPIETKEAAIEAALRHLRLIPDEN